MILEVSPRVKTLTGWQQSYSTSFPALKARRRAWQWQVTFGSKWGFTIISFKRLPELIPLWPIWRHDSWVNKEISDQWHTLPSSPLYYHGVLLLLEEEIKKFFTHYKAVKCGEVMVINILYSQGKSRNHKFYSQKCRQTTRNITESSRWFKENT